MKVKRPLLKKQAKKLQSVDDHYRFEIEGWRLDCTFGIYTKTDKKKPYSDDRSLRLFGKLVTPAKTKLSEIVIYSDHRLIPSDKQFSSAATAIGAFTAVQSEPLVMLWLPADAMPMLIQMLTAGRYKSVTMTKAISEIGCPIVTSYSFPDEVGPQFAGPKID